MVIAVRRMQDLSFALELKGFPPSGRRTFLYQFQWSRFDAAAFALLAVAAAGVVVAKIVSPLLSFPGWPFV
jgi:energy-coupling factor transporter transmembrane protein EcfT